MSPQSGWKKIAPGVSPGLRTYKNFKPAKRATDETMNFILNRRVFRPSGALGNLLMRLPRAYARGYQYAACFAGWLTTLSQRVGSRARKFVRAPAFFAFAIFS